MANRYGIKNVFRPSSLVRSPYGWTTAPQYNRSDVPTALLETTTAITPEQLLQQFSYEWFQSSGVGAGFSNPPFVGGSAGRLLPGLIDANGQPARILRGFIRRAQYSTADKVSQARLYMMYNPETIERQYVSYLDQAALDPFNTVYQSGNLVAPPSTMDFTFELFFDRQEEAQQVDHPGVMVDMQFFDLVVRNVVPTDPNAAGNTLPDNGLMMVNPQDITVIFSPQLTVQGRPLNANIRYEKFTHRMTPTRVRIALTMRVVYMGPVRDLKQYTAEQFVAQAAIPIDEIKANASDVTYSSLIDANTVQTGAVGTGGVVSTASSDAILQQTGGAGIAGDANNAIRLAALQWVQLHTTPATKYDNQGGGRTRLNPDGSIYSADCSGLVYLGYNAVGQAKAMNWGGAPGTSVMASRLSSRTAYFDKNPGSLLQQGRMQVGDLLLRSGNPGHVVFVSGISGTHLTIFGAHGTQSLPQVGSLNQSNGTAYANGFDYLIRPMPLGSNMVAVPIGNNTYVS